ncbi:hypothetical protein VL762_11770 [Flavobacterium psychrophilum]|uniref:hypothetical protein n=1 Tax=Flavobacterium psychrophilum TaxID=96345 RepID=UPI002BC280C9|nr:hypothetical protein [Flavobacterium psychrophilum]
MTAIQILLKPSFDKTRSELGFEENQDYNEDAVLFQQGYNIEILEILPGEKFKIGKDYESGHLENPENVYKIILKNDMDFEDENEYWEEENRDSESIIFYQGKYILREDGITFEQR